MVSVSDLREPFGSLTSSYLQQQKCALSVAFMAASTCIYSTGFNDTVTCVNKKITIKSPDRPTD